VSDLDSRSRLAGYDPQRLLSARLLIVGAGAIGQNLALDLALSGVGEIWIVDFDEFEPHNATRSPLFPTPAESARWGRMKAPAVARKASASVAAAKVVSRPGILPVQGGMPILVDGRCVGGVGVSGVQSHQDEQIAQAGIDALLKG